jgi:hypothetical protein
MFHFYPKFTVAATQPNINGIAPEKQPHKTDMIVFNGIKRWCIKYRTKLNIAYFRLTM